MAEGASEALRYWPVVVVVLNLFLAWVAWSVRHGLASKEDLTAGMEKLSAEIKSGDAALKTAVTEQIGTVEEELGEQVAELTNRVQAGEIQLARLEETVANQPTHADLGRVYDRVGEVSGKLDQLIGEFTGIRHQLGLLLQSHLGDK